MRNTATPFRLVPTRAGLALLLAGALAACGSDERLREPAPIQGLDTLTVGAADAGRGRAWDGVVEAVRQATLTAQTSGRVAEVLRDVNDRVAAGEVLVRLSAVEQQAGVDAARAQLQLAEATYRRMAGLAEGQYVSKMQLDQARAERDAARAQLANFSQQTAYTTIRAPYAGIVASRDVEPGESVGIGQPLMTVFSPGALRIEVSIPQSDAERVRANPVATVTFDDGRSVETSGVTVFPAADPSTHAVKVRLELPALDPAPQPGATAKVAFPAVAGAAHPRIPGSALVRRGEVNAVYVLADGRLSLRQLRLGERAGDDIDVIAGLAPGETIAADPVAAVQALVAARQGD
ncbi:efflux RND transporter periplasmic adaptor subunit [Luteimonas wenzhouensis]|uniref:Efflux RND transporter periplasmic adaptor subunit n=1 Tax=Luteimonas wenzhouensis TaxID=2599615 RepID=A0A5C5TU56_9GAMM|nr:efflux RND transporter periplasmic adaptor subunit [Luteimonas wenzhouensis]TWT17207.1 efflux RND transporter periplasmic adaptor subunit [Luteimonas wenzhouensis]